ncbi:Crp/Fnr family transcriptional regulator [Rubrivirga sp. S365]|uniref:Crp/Fnr family transcriptional regulator n=1 Tax=Rubrivirga litoralis TaxID=3075598 RepID=A0ABU3BN40_9BACT|nr:MULTISPECIES: Crp/Fnr family transcriptional regulator [unclassified Rubrivirga]MDT0630719.1 Crp/Fnr family transcriptional regulator [Rubrivirga sp. F394]MDT7856389.1 Crp/Fnr family transcriptional regulator [Rubrivirga sp. S365]
MPTLDAALAELRRSFERFDPLPDSVWADVRRPWRLRAVRRGEVLTRAGETERTLSLVVEGVQRLSFLADGREVTVAFVYPPDLSGVPDSFFLQTPSAYALDALTDGQVLAADHGDVAALLDRHRELERWAWKLFAAAGAGRAKRERELLTLSAEDRYRRLLREAPHVLQLAAQKHVASYLGMSPETLSRVRSGRS